MALKADRHELETDISFFYNAGTATRGGVVCLAGGGMNTVTGGVSAGSGVALDQAEALVEYTTDIRSGFGAGVPVGILLNDVVNLDLTRQHINWHKDEVQKGGKVTVLRKGWVVTSNIDSVNPTVGAVAYASSGTAGNLTIEDQVPSNERGRLAVGRFLSLLDEDGYAKVAVNLPNFGTV